MLKSRNNFIRNYLSVSLTEPHMATLASIIKDVDKDVKGGGTALLSSLYSDLLDIMSFPNYNVFLLIIQTEL